MSAEKGDGNVRRGNSSEKMPGGIYPGTVWLPESHANLTNLQTKGNVG